MRNSMRAFSWQSRQMPGNALSLQKELHSVEEEAREPSLVQGHPAVPHHETPAPPHRCSLHSQIQPGVTQHPGEEEESQHLYHKPKHAPIPVAWQSLER